MRILVLHQHYWPEIAATAQILADICEDAAAAGHEVTVICGQPSYRSAETLASRDEYRGVRIERVPAYKPGERSIPRRLAHYSSFFGTSLLRALRSSEPSVAIVMSTPPVLLGVSGALLRALRGVPFVYSVQDLYPDIAVDLGVLSRGPLFDVIDACARGLYRSATRVVTLSSGMSDRLAAKGVEPSRLRVIPNWSDERAVWPAPRDNAFARRHGLSGSFTVLYSGNLGRSHGLEQLPRAAEATRDLPVRWAVVGDGHMREFLQAEAARRKLASLLFLPPQPRDALPELLASCDLGLVTMARGIAADLVPSKLYGIMAAGRPVLASVEEGSEVARVIREHRCGRIVPAEDAEALAEAVRRAVAEPELLRVEGQAARRACEREYSRSVNTRRYVEVLEEAARDR